MCGVGDGGRLKDDVGPVTDDDAADAFCQEARSTSVELYLGIWTRPVCSSSRCSYILIKPVLYVLVCAITDIRGIGSGDR